MRTKSNRWIGVGVLTALMTTTLSTMAPVPAQARAGHRSFIRRHPILTAAGAALVYHHYHKKHKRQMQRQGR